MSFPFVHSMMEFSSEIDKKLKSQTAIIESQNKKIEELTESVERLQLVLYQMIGGLFNHETQRGIIGQHCNFVNSSEKYRDFYDPSPWGTYPTTRQGDALEIEIEEMKREYQEKMAEISARIENMEFQNSESCKKHDEEMEKLIKKIEELKIEDNERTYDNNDADDADDYDDYDDYSSRYSG
jgi:archaellum component FlaC